MGDCLDFGRKERVILILVHFTLLVQLWNKFDVRFEVAADVSHRQLSQLDSSLPIQANNVSSDIGRALVPNDDQAVVAARLDLIAPNLWLTQVLLVCAGHLDAILVRLLNLVVYYVRVVVEDFDADHV